MKRKHFEIAACMAILALCFLSCKKPQNLTVSKSEVSFASSGGVGLVQVDADCDWTVEYNGNHEWYVLSRLSGSKQGVILITVGEHHSHAERSASFSVISSNGKTKRVVNIIQQPINIVDIKNKVWFLYEYERWATDYYDEFIEDEYRFYQYYIDESFDNWFFYFTNDNTGYQFHTKNGDTTIYSYEYIYYPLGDSLYINFMTDTVVQEDYHAVIHELNQERFVFSDEHHPHQFEKLFLANLSTRKTPLYINPDKVRKKEHGPLIQIEP